MYPLRHTFSKVFSLYMAMQIPLGKGTGTANSQLVTQGTSQFPIHGLAVVIKYKFPTRGCAVRGKFIFHHVC